ncbi:hypothetical protein [Gemmata massiliana]|uniref:hypothetical protein n=1 Tax=Gemmata massiliana TaxID=1210884 RepID=UPI0013A6E944|nr:hypothetical protein [Gemmata massiliana]
MALAWLSFCWRAVVASALVYWLLVTCAVLFALEGNVRPGLVRPIANAVGVPISLLMCGSWVWWNAHQLSRSYLGIEGTVVTFRGRGARGVVIERRYQIHELASVVFGQPLNAVERGFSQLTSGVLQTAREGRLFVTSIYGKCVTFQFMNLAFHPSEVREFIAELNRRGVGARRRTEPSDDPDPYSWPVSPDAP